MPYPNEHAARIVEPSKFEPNSFRRKNIEKGIDIIIGKLKGEDKTTTQAYRFNIKYFTAQQARKWLKDNNIKYISLEPAEPEKANTMSKFYSTKNISEGAIKDVDIKTATVTGYLSKFNNIDLDGEMIVPGAFKKSINERGPNGTNQIWFLKHHDWSQLLSKFNVLKEDKNGLYFESTLNTEISYVKDVLQFYADRLYNEHSIGFTYIKNKREFVEENGKEYFKLSEVKLYEGSVVPLGANPETPFIGFKACKSAQAKQHFCIEKINKIQKALKISSLHDDTYLNLNMQLTQLQQLLSETLIKDTLQPSQDIAQPSEVYKNSNTEILKYLINKI